MANERQMTMVQLPGKIHTAQGRAYDTPCCRLTRIPLAKAEGLREESRCYLFLSLVTTRYQKTMCERLPESRVRLIF